MKVSEEKDIFLVINKKNRRENYKINPKST